MNSKWDTWSNDEQTDGNQLVYSPSQAEEAIGKYLNGAPPEGLEKARKAFIRKFYFMIDSHASLRCAVRIHREITERCYSDEQQRATRALTQTAARRRVREQTRTPLGRTKHLMRIGQHRTLRPWKPAFGERTEQITPEMLTALYRRYDRAFKPTNETVAVNGFRGFVSE